MKTLEHFVEFSDELYNDRYYGESLLVLHGISFGVKIGKQLKLKWSDFINEIGHVKDFVVIDGRTIPLNTTCKIRTLVIYRLLKNKIKLTDYIYTTKKGVLLSTSNLSKDLKRLAKKIYNVEYDDLTSSSLEKVWALSIIEHNGYDKSIFIFLKDYMGKKTTNELIEFVGVQPKEKNILKFDLIDDLKIRIYQN
jgi:hypothetical protein